MWQEYLYRKKRRLWAFENLGVQLFELLYPEDIEINIYWLMIFWSWRIIKDVWFYLNFIGSETKSSLLGL